MNWRTSDVNGLCITILLNNMVWYLGVIWKPHNDEFFTYIFTGKFENGTPIVFNNKLYYYWYKEIINHFQPILINTTHRNIHFSNQINGKITSSSVTYPETKILMACCCCFPGHRFVQYDWIMRWWCSNLGQGLLRS